MEITNKDILILGGWGLVGTALCRQLLVRNPRSLIILSLTQEQAESACQELAAEAGDTKLIPAWGNIFVRSDFKDLSRDEILNNPQNRMKLSEDVLEQTTSFEHFFLYDLIIKYRPHVIIDCINSATGLAYQDVYSVGLKVHQGLLTTPKGGDVPDLLEEVEKLLCSLYLPQLIRHIQVLYQAMKEAGTQSYVKVGTSGTGGMGLNIPYTHSEGKPSRVLLSKTSLAGAHSLLLFLMGRTPDAPYVKEVKPATAIAWKRITYGEILRHGEPIALYDCPPDRAMEIGEKLDTSISTDLVELNKNLKGIFIDTGENGTFSPGEFTAITTQGQMEFITPEEIAQTVIWEIEGGATGHDIVAALDASVLSSTYRAGVMRSLAIQKMRKLSEDHKDEVVAFELLGPPRLSKLLYEAHILKKIAGSLNNILANSPEELSDKAVQLINEDRILRSKIISIGIPILLSDGQKLLRGQAVKVPHDPRSTIFDATPDNINHWCDTGWVDLRVSNMKKWHDRIGEILKHAGKIGGDDSSSQFIRDATFWHPDDPLDEGELVGWIFINEDKGKRMK
ncbi:MAG: hypothetical protein P9X24_19525 [Candidatus Hatepunaea meridiana]|nr:hypothetical protein [Candidatus Hatepunaea meridiana]